MKIIEKKLGREGAMGVWREPGLIHIDPRLKPRKHLEILIHEMLHEVFPPLSETAVTKGAKRICSALWNAKYRRIKE
jgi:hypothetical protein